MKLRTADEWLNERMMEPIHGDAVRFTADEIRDVQRNALEAAAKALRETVRQDARDGRPYLAAQMTRAASIIAGLIPENPAPAGKGEQKPKDPACAGSA
jgi:hypothetical protein